MQNLKRVLISQPKPLTEKSPYFDIEKKYDVTLEFKPFIKVEPVCAKEFRTQKINVLDHTAVIFTAKTGIDHFFRLRDELRITIPDDMKYFCSTEAVSLYLQKYIQYRKRKVFFGQNGQIDEFAQIIQKHAEEKFLVVVSDVHEANKTVCHKKDIIDVLEEFKVSYSKAVMYRTVSANFKDDPDFNYDMFVFFSPSGINSLFENFPNFSQGDVKIGCFGTSTVTAAKERGLVVNVEAPTAQTPSMPGALAAYFDKLS